jgi:pimeloyl-ACP methyl ester carboxylesterase
MMAMAACGHTEEPAAAAARLPQLPLNPAAVTVSGISAGGYMAVQFHVAHSALVRGAGIVAAGPYLCAEGSLRHALGRCMQGDEEIPTARWLASSIRKPVIRSRRAAPQHQRAPRASRPSSATAGSTAPVRCSSNCCTASSPTAAIRARTA